MYKRQGLDTDFSDLPEDFVDSTLTKGENIVRFNRKLIDATKAVAGCYKAVSYTHLDVYKRQVLDASVLYLRIIAISYPFLALYNGGAALFLSLIHIFITGEVVVVDLGLYPNRFRV